MLLQQLRKPVIMTGDFKSYLNLWGKPLNENNGYQVLNFIKKTAKHFKRRQTYKNIGYVKIGILHHNTIFFFIAQHFLECYRLSFK